MPKQSEHMLGRRTPKSESDAGHKQRTARALMTSILAALIESRLSTIAHFI
jgi:hypothetical protein